jgi:hypothetical protein
MEPVKTMETVSLGVELQERAWTYDEILEGWVDDSMAMVPVLARRCKVLEEELETVRKKQLDALDTVMACLKAVSGIENEDDLERVVCATSTKPSEFIRNTLAQRAEQMQKQKQELDLALSTLDDIAWRFDWQDEDRIEAAREALEEMRGA